MVITTPKWTPTILKNGSLITPLLKKLDKVQSQLWIMLFVIPEDSSKKIEVPTTATKKADVQKWLTEKNIAFEATEIKAQLLQKVNKA